MAWAYPARAPLPARQCGDSFRHWPASARGVAVHCSEADHRKQRRTAHPWSDLHSRVHVTIRARNLFTREQAVLLAVSGGQVGRQRVWPRHLRTQVSLGAVFWTATAVVGLVQRTR